ncbi:MAG TPA: AbrB family transcriptional regulator [Deltaproteobacteria bacterium]|nr:MAG: AbrB family transcriptional regulator [Deltaproteobacteria bacterium GWC2_65_14]HBO68848.1 AbrB family transcriptional regulator [Deltaproteobacteria bacterium]
MKETRRKDDSCYSTGGIGGCKVESLVSVDDRGQLVLPKEIRDRTGIKGGDKLAVVTWEKEGKVCCLTLIRVEELTGMVKNLLGPLMGDVLGNR